MATRNDDGLELPADRTDTAVEHLTTIRLVKADKSPVEVLLQQVTPKSVAMLFQVSACNAYI